MPHVATCREIKSDSKRERQKERESERGREMGQTGCYSMERLVKVARPNGAASCEAEAVAVAAIGKWQRANGKNS